MTSDRDRDAWSRWAGALAKPARRGPKPRRPIRRGARPRAVGLGRYRELVREADWLWRALVLTGVRLCARCGRKPPRDAHHLISRRYHRTRWVLTNGAALCRGCHALVGEDSEENTALALSLVGEAVWRDLSRLRHVGPKPDPAMAVVLLKAELARRDRR